MLGQAGAEYAPEAAQIAGLRERLAQGRFHLAVLGQFKRGKSTLLNALLGMEVLPTSVLPLTAIPTFLRQGETPGATIRFQGNQPPREIRAASIAELQEQLAGYVGETANPKNRLGVDVVEVAAPARLLQQGMVLIDTPGIGSVFRHNTEATLNFLPQCDAALFVVSADPPITEVEVAFLKEVATKVQRIVFVLNKADLLKPEEQTLTLGFLRRTLAESMGGGAPPRIYPVSSRLALEARTGGAADAWQRSGLAALEQHLLAFLANEKQAALGAAIARKAAAGLGEAGLKMRLMVQSLEMPLADLEKRLKQFDLKIAEAEQQRISAGDLLAGARNRMATLLEEQAEALRRKYRKTLRDTVRAALDTAAGPDEETARNALAEAIPVFFERELGEMSRSFNQRVAEALQPHEKRAADIIGEVRRHAAELFDVPYRPPESESAYLAMREPYWVTHRWGSSLSPLPEGWFDRFLPGGWRRRRIQRRLEARIEELVVSNVENLRWSTLQNLDTSFRRFASDLDERLRLTVEATRGAIRAALRKRQSHAAAIAGEVQRLRAALEEIDRLAAKLGKGA